MKFKQLSLLKFAFFLALIISVFNSKADHELGSQITYSCTGTPGVYSVTLKVYRGCYGIQLCANCPTSLSPSCSKTLNIKGAASPAGSGLPTSPCAGVSFGSQNALVVTSVSGFDVVQLCNTVKTVCSNCGTRTPGTFTPGIEVYTFQGDINLSSLPASCCLVSIGFSTCCRNSSSTTLANPNSLNFFSEAIINRCATPCNSSPTYALESEFVVPSGKDFILNLGATDPDGDSLSYHMGSALIGPSSPAPYASSFSQYDPFPYLGFGQGPPILPPLGINMNPINGNYRFRPIGTFVEPMVIEIRQWKTIAGVPTLMGITRKEHNFYSVASPANNTPIIKIDTSIQTSYTYSMYDTICSLQPYCKTIVAMDADASDTTDISWSVNPLITSSGGIITPFYNAATRGSNGPRQDSVKFCWTPPNILASSKPYYLNFIARDRACPLKGKTLINLGLVVNFAPTASINKVFINATTQKFKYTKTNTAYNNPALTQWQIETGHKSNIYTSYNADSVTSHTFTNNGWHQIKLLLAGNCGSPITIRDSILVTNFNLTLIEAKNIICKNDSSGRIIVKATGGWPPYQYQIKVGSNLSAFGTNDTFSNLAANAYTINVKDSLSNTTGANAGSLIVSLTQPLNSIALNVLSKKRPTCNGDSNGVITIGAIYNTGPFQVKLGSDSFQNNKTFANLKPAIRQFTIKDSLGCMASQSISLTDPLPLNRSISSLSHVKCKGDATGFISLAVSGGILPYKLRINGSTYQTGGTFSNQKAGPKLIEIVDSNDCLKSLSTTLNEPATNVTLSVVSKTDISCANPRGSVTLLAAGGTPPYQYGVNLEPSTPSPVKSNLLANFYYFYVRDSNLCYISVGDAINTITPLNLTLSKKDASCKGLQNGTITCVTTGGTGFYQYKLDTGAYGSSPVFNNVATGTHVISVKDSALKDTSTCVKTSQITINEPTSLSSSIVSTKTACVGASTGTAEVFVSGGKMPYTYSWSTSPAQNGAKANNLPAGKVLVTITDSSSCLRTDSVVILAKPIYNDEVICAVSVDSTTNQNLIVWNKTPDKGTAAYQIWVAPNGTAIPTLLTTIPYNSPSAFLDNISAPLPASQAYYYSLKSVDSCANTSTLSFTHKPLSLSNTVSGNRVNLSWISYSGGLNINQYKVYRANNNGAYNIIATVAYGTNTYVDSLGGSGAKHYIIEGVYSPACFANFKVFSNPVSVIASGLQEASIVSSGYLVYPNPSTGKIFIKKQANGQDIKKVEVTSIMGSVLYVIENDKPLSEQNIDLSQLAAGTYHLVISTNKGTKQTQQIILQR
jgi:hypothetical protein